MQAPRNVSVILLTGPKHSGKTSAGRALAALGGWTFTDLDELVEARTGKSPRTLYKEGAEVFRAAEAAALEGLIGGGAPPAGGLRIAAAGGGIIDNPRAMALLKNSPGIISVYLEISSQTAWERIERAAAESGELPPFLDTADPRQAHSALHRRRAGEYQKAAPYVVQGEGKSPERIAREIIDLLKRPGSA
jgi:shikimate kinase